MVRYYHRNFAAWPAFFPSLASGLAFFAAPPAPPACRRAAVRAQAPAWSSPPPQRWQCRGSAVALPMAQPPPSGVSSPAYATARPAALRAGLAMPGGHAALSFSFFGTSWVLKYVNVSVRSTPRPGRACSARVPGKILTNAAPLRIRSAAAPLPLRFAPLRSPSCRAFGFSLPLSLLAHGGHAMSFVSLL